MGTKWNEAKPGEKLLALYSWLLFSNEKPTLSELARELGCSKPSVLRLIDQVDSARFGRILKENSGREVRFSMERPSRLPKICLDASALRDLSLCQAFMLHMMAPAMREKLRHTLGHTAAYTDRPDDGESLSVPYAHAATKGRISYDACGQVFQNVEKAIRQRSVCSIRYRAMGKAEPSEYDFAPMELISYHDSFIVSGWIVTAMGRVEPLYPTPTNLYLHRIEEAAPTRRSSARLAAPSHGKAFGIFSGEPFTAVIRFDASSADYVADRIWSEDQVLARNEDGSLTLTMSCTNRHELASFVLGFGASAELLEPAGMRADLRKTLASMAERYAEGTPD